MPVVAPVRGRAAFAALADSPIRARRDGVSVRRAGNDDPPRVAFAVGRRVGSAVVRNRVRRRLRSAVRSLRAEGALPEGTYLIGVAPDAAHRTQSSLTTALREAVRAL